MSNKIEKSLKQHHADFYQSQEMSHYKLNQLLELSETMNSKNRLSKRRTSHWFSIAAAILIVVSLSFGIDQYRKKEINQIVFQEIALNHIKKLSLEFKANNYETLDNMMNKLDFTLLASSNKSLAGLTILGARYCSIQGNLAAQIRLEDKNGTYYTLYQTPLTSALKKEETGNIQSNDIEVIQWQENQLFFGLAKSQF